MDGGAGSRRHARALYWMGWRITHIADYLGVPRTTLHEWGEVGKRAEAKPLERVEGTLEARLCALINKDGKTGGDFKEIDLLGAGRWRRASNHHNSVTERSTSALDGENCSSTKVSTLC